MCLRYAGVHTLNDSFYIYVFHWLLAGEIHICFFFLCGVLEFCFSNGGFSCSLSVLYDAVLYCGCEAWFVCRWPRTRTSSSRQVQASFFNATIVLLANSTRSPRIPTILRIVRVCCFTITTKHRACVMELTFSSTVRSLSWAKCPCTG